MKGICKVFIFGRLGRKSELKTFPRKQTSFAPNNSDFKIIDFSLAINSAWKDDNGNWHEKVDWYTISAFDQIADKIAQDVQKGDFLYAECQLKEQNWNTDTGEERKALKLTARAIQILNKSKKSQDSEFYPEMDNSIYDFGPKEEFKDNTKTSQNNDTTIQFQENLKNNEKDKSITEEEFIIDDDYIPFA